MTLLSGCTDDPVYAKRRHHCQKPHTTGLLTTAEVKRTFDASATKFYAIITPWLKTHRFAGTAEIELGLRVTAEGQVETAGLVCTNVQDDDLLLKVVDLTKTLRFTPHDDSSEVVWPILIILPE